MSEPRFINRVEELKALEKLATSITTLPIYLYGPEGCGKTRLLKEFIKRFNGIAVYIDALEGESIEKALITNPVIKELREFAKEVLPGISGTIGAYLANKITSILEKVSTKISIKDKPLLIAVDDVTRAIGLSKIEWYVKWLYELIKKLWEDYKPKSILIIATTSEGQSLDLILRHTYASTRLIWNLDQKAFNELIQELNPPNQAAIEDLWRVIGGNPRALIEIAYNYKWNIDTWLNVLKRKLAKTLITIRSRNLVKELKYVIENPDTIHDKPSPKMEELYKLLIEENLFIYKYMPTLNGGEIPKDPNLGIGKYYAWQIPAYRQILKELL